jgi:hypothetical protein
MKSDREIHVFINRKKYELDSPQQTGANQKALAGIPSGDVLFLQQPGEDEVITNEGTVTLKNGDHLHSQPPADYGAYEAAQLAAELGAGRPPTPPRVAGLTWWSAATACPTGSPQAPSTFSSSCPPLFRRPPPTCSGFVPR